MTLKFIQKLTREFLLTIAEGLLEAISETEGNSEMDSVISSSEAPPSKCIAMSSFFRSGPIFKPDSEVSSI